MSVAIRKLVLRSSLTFRQGWGSLGAAPKFIFCHPPYSFFFPLSPPPLPFHSSPPLTFLLMSVAMRKLALRSSLTFKQGWGSLGAAPKVIFCRQVHWTVHHTFSSRLPSPPVMRNRQKGRLEGVKPRVYQPSQSYEQPINQANCKNDSHLLLE